MIGFLHGTLLEKEIPTLILQVNGIGYEIQLAASSFGRLPNLGQELSLYVHMIKREDGEFLYGFINREQKKLFKELIKISNIGPKIALAVLSAMEPREFIQHLSGNNVMALEGIPGIGSKTAKRLIIELKDKLDGWWINSDITSSSDISDSAAINDAVSALLALGYKPHEARQALHALPERQLPSEELVRLALKKIN